MRTLKVATVLAAVACAAATMVGVPNAPALITNSYLPQAGDRLPDGRPIRPFEIRVRNAGAMKQLQFSMTTVNMGTGPLELMVYREGAGGGRQIITNRDVGDRLTQVRGTLAHDHRVGHDHIHFNDYA